MPILIEKRRPDWFVISSAITYALETCRNEAVLTADAGAAGFASLLATLGNLVHNYAWREPRAYRISLDVKPATEADPSETLFLKVLPIAHISISDVDPEGGTS